MGWELCLALEVQEEATRALFFLYLLGGSLAGRERGLPLNYSNCLMIKKKQAAAFEVDFRGVPTFSGRMS